jgi:hypothetical protein
MGDEGFLFSSFHSVACRHVHGDGCMCVCMYIYGSVLCYVVVLMGDG